MQLHNRINREELKKRLMEETFRRKTISFYKYHYLRNQGFEDVNQLHGGILEYARQIKATKLDSKFIGKNFVFDERLGESVNGQIISRCHQCGKLCDTHTNCANNRCHLLFIQCEACKTKYDGCCTPECADEKAGNLSVAKEKRFIFGNSRKYRKSLALVRAEQKLESTKSQITNIK